MRHLKILLARWNELSARFREGGKSENVIESNIHVAKTKRSDALKADKNLTSLEAQEESIKHEVESVMKNLVNLWSKYIRCGYFQHIADSSLEASNSKKSNSLPSNERDLNILGMDVFPEVLLNINRSFQCEQIIKQLPTGTE